MAKNAQSQTAFKNAFMGSDLELYKYRDQLQGVKDQNGKKYRFTTLFGTRELNHILRFLKMELHRDKNQSKEQDKSRNR